jgi:hypothetical protein
MHSKQHQVPELRKGHQIGGGSSAWIEVILLRGVPLVPFDVPACVGARRGVAVHGRQSPDQRLLELHWAPFSASACMQCSAARPC